jgi:Flp pilus assembly protein TadB
VASDEGERVSSRVIERSDALREQKAVTREPSGRNWLGIGLSLAAALAAIAVYVVCIWWIVVLVEALA